MTSTFQIPALLMVVALLWVPSAGAQLIRSGSASAALGRPVVLREPGPDAANPAAFSGLRGFSVSLHAARPYHLEALHVARLAAGLGGLLHGVGVVLERMGYADYAETTAGVTGAVAVRSGTSSTVSIGARARALRFAPRGYPDERAFAVDVGWMVSFDSVVTAGAVLDGLGMSGGLGGASAPAVSVGAAWHAGASFDLLAHARRDPGFPIQYGLGVQTRLHDALFLRTGITTEPVQLCGGIGLRRGVLHIDVAVVSHPVLGLSSSLTLGIRQSDGP